MAMRLYPVPVTRFWVRAFWVHSRSLLGAYSMQDYHLRGLIDRLSALDDFQSLASRVLEAGEGALLGPMGVPAGARPAVIAALHRKMRHPTLWLVDQPDEARPIADSLAAMFEAPDRVFVVPAPDAMPYERIPWDPMTRESRLVALSALQAWHRDPDPTGMPPIVVASVRALLQYSMAPTEFTARMKWLKLGERVDISGLLFELQQMGYARSEQVRSAGEFAHRGGIVDIFPPVALKPMRVEFFDDEIESIREFDPNSQRSSAQHKSLWIVPASEALAHRGPEILDVLDSVSKHQLHPLADSELSRQRKALAEGRHFDGIEFYTSLLHPECVTLIDYLSDDSWVIIESLDRLGTVAHSLHEQSKVFLRTQSEAGELPADWPGRPLAPWSDIDARLCQLRQLRIGRIGADESKMPALNAHFESVPSYGGRIEEAVMEIAERSEAGAGIIVVSRQAPRIAELHEQCRHSYRGHEGPRSSAWPARHCPGSRCIGARLWIESRGSHFGTFRRD